MCDIVVLYTTEIRACAIYFVCASAMPTSYEKQVDILISYIAYFPWWKTFAVSRLYLHSQKTFTVTSFYKLS